MRVLICGDRNWPEEGAFPIGNAIAFLPKGTVIVHGGCRGVDKIAGAEASMLNYPVEVFEADWKQYGKAAGPIRNQAMLDSGIDKVLAFHPNIKDSKGTLDMVQRATRAGVPVEIITQ